MGGVRIPVAGVSRIGKTEFNSLLIGVVENQGRSCLAMEILELVGLGCRRRQLEGSLLDIQPATGIGIG